MDYLLSEVLANLPAVSQEFLLQTAILNRLHGALCDAVTGQGGAEWNGQRHLAWLEQENLFTVALDDSGQWYRYHHLLQRLLQEQLEQRFTAQEIAELHRRAGAWYAAHGLVEEAIAHTLAAGDEAGAAELVEANRHAMMNRELWQVLERWLQLLPRRIVATRPGLLMAEAWLFQSRWRIEDTLALLDQVEVMVAQEPLAEPQATYLRSEIDTLRSHVAFHLFDLHGQLTYAERALASAPPALSSVRGHAWMDCAVAHYLLGNAQGWRTAVHEALNEDRLHGNAFPTRVLQGYCFLTWMDGDMASLQQGAAYLLKLSCERELALGEAWGHYFLGCAAYQLNDLHTAEREFGAVVSRRYLAHGFTYLQASFGLATVLLARGAADAARAAANAVLAYAWERGDKSIMDEAKAFQAYLSLRLGSRAEARRWAAGYDFARPLIPFIMFHAAPVTVARILGEQRTAQSLAAAAAWLQRLHKFAAETYNTRFLVEVAALQALLHSTHGREAAALGALEQALLLAEPGGLLRVFVDLGAPMEALLRKLPLQGAGSAFAEKTLAAFPAHVPAPASGAQAPQVLVTAGHRGMASPLSRRELEVLELLAQRLTVKEVAEQLVISELTAKRHTANIYQKLGVNRRRDALAAAQAAGLLVYRQP
jgi:LuxR family maltose regulon positive regulatory protein